MFIAEGGKGFNELNGLSKSAGQQVSCCPNQHGVACFCSLGVIENKFFEITWRNFLNSVLRGSVLVLMRRRTGDELGVEGQTGVGAAEVRSGLQLGEGGDVSLTTRGIWNGGTGGFRIERRHVCYDQ